MILLFTLVDYAAFGLWIIISILLSYVLVRKLNLFGGDPKSQKILAIGLVTGHLVYLVWKTFWLFILSFFLKKDFALGLSFKTITKQL